MLTMLLMTTLTTPSLEELLPQDVVRKRAIFSSSAAAVSAQGSSTKYIDPPSSFLKSQTYPDAAEWLAATWDEIESFIKMKVLLPLEEPEVPSVANIVGTRFVYCKLKRTEDGGIER